MSDSFFEPFLSAATPILFVTIKLTYELDASSYPIQNLTPFDAESDPYSMILTSPDHVY